MRRGRSRIVMMVAAAFVLPLGAWSAPSQPEPAKEPAREPTKDAAKGTPQERGAQLRERLRERLARYIETMKADQAKLEEALKKIDAGAAFEEVRDLLPDSFSGRFRNGGDAPPGAGPDDGEGSPGMRRGGERGERFGGGMRSDQPFSSEDWEAVDAIITHAQPEMLPKFKELREKDPEQAQRRTLEAYPRLRPLLELYRRDRAGFDLRLDEMVIIRQSLPLAKKVIELRKEGKADDSTEMKAARAELRVMAQRQHQNRSAIQRHDLEMMRKHIERREKELNDQSGNPDPAIDRAMEGLIKQAERGGEAGPGRGDKPERLDPGADPDRPRRRSNDKD